MFDGGVFIIHDKVKDAIKHFDLHGMQFYPSILIEKENAWDEKYWYLNIWEDIDCWDREKSDFEIIEDEGGSAGDDVMVDPYSLNSSVLGQLKEEKRLLFRMGNDGIGKLFMHQKMVDVIESSGFTGIRFFKVSEFEEGDQY